MKRFMDTSVTFLDIRLVLRPLLATVEEHREKVKTSESFWTLEDGELHVTLCKLAKGVPWPSVFAGDEALDALGGEAEKKRLMLQRFQEEVRIASRGSVWGDHEGGPAHPASA